MYALLGQKRTKVPLTVAILKQSFRSISLTFLYTYQKSFYEEDDNPFWFLGIFSPHDWGISIGLIPACPFKNSDFIYVSNDIEMESEDDVTIVGRSNDYGQYRKSLSSTGLGP